MFLQFVQQQLCYREIFQKHLALPIAYENDTSPTPSAPVIQNGMMMVPKADRDNAPYVTEYHQMDQLDFHYYHAAPDCPFRNVLCNVSECSYNKVAAFFNHLQITPHSISIFTTVSTMINEITQCFPEFYCDCDHYTVTRSKTVCTLKIPQKHGPRVTDHSQLLPHNMPYL